MLELRNIISNSIKNNLYSVKFNILADEIEDGVLTCDDHFEENEKSENEFSFFIKRHVYFEPASTLDIEVVFLTERRIKEEYIGEIDLRDFDIKKEFLKDYAFYTDYDECWLSLIISQLTSSFGNAPLITPPMLFLKEEDANQKIV